MTSAAVCVTTVCFPLSVFTGKERDTESGNDYFEARYYLDSAEFSPRLTQPSLLHPGDYPGFCIGRELT